MASIASAIAFVGMLYFAFTYHTWEWWVIAVLVLSFLGIGAKDWVNFKRSNETHYHYGGDKNQNVGV